MVRLSDLENGYTRIANEILENIAKVKMSSTQHCLILIIWRYTYGFSRKKHELSLSFLSKATNYNQRNIQRELKRLEDRKIIKQSIVKNKRIIAFNKYCKDWKYETDIGEIDNGETTNGEIDDRRNRQGRDGETDNDTIGETANQERKKEKYKESSVYDDFVKEVLNLYPGRKSKSTRDKKLPKIIKEYGQEEILKCVTRYKKSVEGKSINYILNESTFWNGRYIDYLTENFEEVKEKGIKVTDGKIDTEFSPNIIYREL